MPLNNETNQPASEQTENYRNKREREKLRCPI